MTILVAGAGGAIGGHLVKRLSDQGHLVRAVDKKKLQDWFQIDGRAHSMHFSDVSDYKVAVRACTSVDWVFNLACDMGGMGFLHNNRVECLHSVDITSAMIKAACSVGVERYFYTSSACVYPDYKQQVELVSLKEEDAWPADPEPAYGLEKLYGEEFCKWYRLQYGLDTRVARLHNVYGSHGTWTGGREKAPAAICRKIAEAVISGDHRISIWGDGEQTRSFMHVDDCVEGFIRLMESSHTEPINLGSSELVSINQLVDIIEDIAGIKVEREYDLSAPQGVRGRNSDNTLIKEKLGWEPTTSLREGLEKTYPWIFEQVKQQY